MKGSTKIKENQKNCATRLIPLNMRTESSMLKTLPFESLTKGKGYAGNNKGGLLYTRAG
jgi:hypothetical protein